MLNTISSETYVFLGFNGIHVSFLMNLKFNKINASEIYICICITFMCVLRRAEPWIYAPTFQYKFKLMKLLSRVSNSHTHTHTPFVLFCSVHAWTFFFFFSQKSDSMIESIHIIYRIFELDGGWREAKKNLLRFFAWFDRKSKHMPSTSSFAENVKCVHF